MASAQKCINTLRVLAADTVQKANSGHPGAPMGMAPIAYVLWTKFLKYNPTNPNWANRDRFVLSNGHACALQYSILHLTGYPDWTMDDLKNFRQLGSKSAGHPENYYPGIEVTTGPLGQGLANAVGLAIAEKHLAARYNKPGFKIVDNYTFVFCGDGCLQEGITSEACSLAGHLGLGKLIVIYDDNRITIDGETDLAFTEDVLKRYEAYGWHTQYVENGDEDIAAIEAAIDAAMKVEDKPSIIKVRTTIGFGSAKQGKEAVHGAPLGEKDLADVKQKFGFDPNLKFHVDPDVYEAYDHKQQGKAAEDAWNALFAEYEKKYPELAAEYKRRMEGKLPDGWEQLLPRFQPDGPAEPTRRSSGRVLNALAKALPELMGGSADLNPSCFTYLDEYPDFQKDSPEGRNIRFGVREHAMAAIMNGMAAYGGFIPYGSTFLNFIGYAYGAVVLSSLSHFKVIYVMTHDSIGLGEDGPTHQPIEKLMLCRSTPNMLLIRPADGNETSGAYLAALKQTSRPTVIALSRQNVPQLKGTSPEAVLKGAYVLADCDGKPDVIIAATGSEVSLAVSAKEKVTDLKIRVVSFPSWELFEEQSDEYKKSVFTPGVPVLSVEAGSVVGWSTYAHGSIGMRTFGASAPASKLYERFGFSVDNIVKNCYIMAKYYKGDAPVLLDRPPLSY